MRERITWSWALIAIVGLCLTAEAQPNVFSQEVSIVVSKIQTIQFNETELSFEISTAEPGQQPKPSAVQSGFSMTNNTSNWIITAQLDESLPAGLSLEAKMNLGSTGESSFQTLSASPVTLLAGSEGKTASNQTIEYRATASPDLAPASYSRAIVFTIMTRN